MAVYSLFATTFSHSRSYTPLNFFTSLQSFNGDSVCNFKPKGRVNRIFCVKVRVMSSHSNPKILKRNRKSRFGEPVSSYDSDEDDEDEDDEDSDVDEGDDGWISDDEFADVKLSEADRQRIKLKNSTQMKQGPFKHLQSSLGTSTLNSGSNREKRQHKLSPKTDKDNLKKQPNGILNHTSRQSLSIDSLGDSRKSKDVLKERVNGVLDNASRQSAGVGSLGDSRKKEAESSSKNRFSRLSEEIDLEKRWYPLLDYLSTFGLKDSEFIQIYERHMQALQINVDSAEKRLGYLLSVGVKHRDIKKIISRQPQILGYSVENNLKPHVAFLGSLGIPESRIGQIITATPSLFSYSIDNSLTPTVKYLLEEIGIEKSDLSKVVQLSPQILVQRIESTWNTRYNFLTKELRAPRKSIVKMVTKHPQILHYSIEDGLLPRINFLRSIGMSNSDILKVFTSLTQVFSLSVEGNLKPKYKYLINELRNEVHSLAKYPMYLSLSLDQRIRPRHRFLVSLKKAPRGPFPLSSLVPTDESFCQQWAGTSLDKYLDFRKRLLVKELAMK